VRPVVAESVSTPQRPLPVTGAATPFQSKCNRQGRLLADSGNQGNYTPMAAIRLAPDAPGENLDFALPASAPAISVFAAKVRCHFSSASGLGRLPPLGISPASRIAKTAHKVSVAMLTTIALTGIVAGRTDHNAWSSLLRRAKANEPPEIVGPLEESALHKTQKADSSAGARPERSRGGLRMTELELSRRPRQPGFIAACASGA